MNMNEDHHLATVIARLDPWNVTEPTKKKWSEKNVIVGLQIFENIIFCTFSFFVRCDIFSLHSMFDCIHVYNDFQYFLWLFFFTDRFVCYSIDLISAVSS